MNINRHFVTTSVTPPNSTGIDKLILTTKDFRVKDVSTTGLYLQPATIDLTTGASNDQLLFTDLKGKEIKGKSAYMNVEGCYSLDIDRTGLRLILNPSKLFHSYELCTDEKTLLEGLNTVFADVRNKGISANFDQLNINRIDLTRNGIMENHCIAYAPIFTGLGIKRAKSVAQYPDGYRSSNKQFGLTFYNKGIEAGIDIHNMLRGELQFKKSNGAMNKRLGLHTIAALKETSFTDMNESYLQIMQKEIFKTDFFSSQGQISFLDKKQELELLISVYGKSYAITKFLVSNSIDTLFSLENSTEQFVNLLEQNNYSRKTIWKHKKNIEKLLSVKASIKGSKGISKLYKEMLLKFAA